MYNYYTVAAILRKKEKRLIKTKLAKLIDVKSIITILLTAGFLYLTVTGLITAEQFMTVFTVVIAFYFGTQQAKKGVGSNAD